MGSVRRQENGTYRARYRDERGREHHRRFKRQAEARAWVKAGEAAVQRGDHLDRKTAETTVAVWVERWLEGYASRRPSTLRQAQVHCRVIVAEFGDRRLGDVRPSDVSAWVAKLGEKYAPSTRYAIYRRFAQATIDTPETHNQLFEYFTDKIYIGREQGVIASYSHDSATPIELEDLEEVLTSGNRAGKLRTYVRKQEFDSSPSSGA